MAILSAVRVWGRTLVFSITDPGGEPWRFSKSQGGDSVVKQNSMKSHFVYNKFTIIITSYKSITTFIFTNTM